MRYLTLIVIFACLYANKAAANTWGELQDVQHSKVVQLFKDADLELLNEQWDTAERSIKEADWFFDQWNKKGFMGHDKVKTLLPLRASLKKRLSTKQAIDPDRAKSKWYVRREGGKKKKGGLSPETPLRFLYRVLDQAQPGDMVRISGPVYGKQSAGHFSFDKPHLTLVGGYNEDFTERNKSGSIVSRRPDSSVTSSLRHLMEFKNASNLVIDGLVFDPQYHYIYDKQAIRIDRSQHWSVLRIEATGSVVIRNSAFINSLGPAIELITTPDAKIIIENCLFLNNVAESINVRGGGQLIVKNSTFALLWTQRSRPGVAVRIRTKGSLVFKKNVVAYADMAVQSVNGNENIELYDNISHCLNHCFIHMAGNGTEQYLQIADLEDTELEEEGNRVADVDLPLAPESTLKYLLSSKIADIEDEALRKQMIKRYADRMPELKAGEPTAKAEEPEEEDVLTDPFANDEEEDPFGITDKEESEGQTEKEKAQATDTTKGAEQPAEETGPQLKEIAPGDYYALPYIWTGWVAPS